MSVRPDCFRRKDGEMPSTSRLADFAARCRNHPDLVPLVLLAAFAALPVAAALAGQSHLVSLFTRVMIFAIAALGLDLIVGYGALVSFGHAAFVGLGAYAVGILAAHGI